MLRDYGIPAVAARSAATVDEALAAAAELGYPVALKTDAPGIPHKSDAGGVRLGITSPAELTAAYHDLSARLGPRVTVTEMAAPGPELILGMARDPALGPLIVVGAGGILAEYWSSAPWRSPRSPRKPPRRCSKACAAPKSSAESAGSPRATSKLSLPPSPASRPWSPTWGSTWMPSKSTRWSAPRPAPSPWTR